MTTTSQRQKGRVGALSALNAAVEALNLAKEISSITPAKAVFGSVCFLLAMIGVYFFLFHNEQLEADKGPGFDGQSTGVYRTWAVLRRCVSNPRARAEREIVR